ncbi:hypothetical protein MTR_6g078360 [Medicago truncatula]|uniref:Uncharacterized protein n=1 Tax=Medicago truncatula TaxID=3880 RepID=G7KKR6_MEDTR|nr:hypothetical protein MTR_6g078360 [Medicago truncatula]
MPVYTGHDRSNEKLEPDTLPIYGLTGRTGRSDPVFKTMGGMLWDRFRRLFELSVNPDVSVTAMRRDSWKVDGVGWRWRRRLFAWEEEHIFA